MPAFFVSPTRLLRSAPTSFIATIVPPTTEAQQGAVLQGSYRLPSTSWTAPNTPHDTLSGSRRRETMAAKQGEAAVEASSPRLRSGVSDYPVGRLTASRTAHRLGSGLRSIPIHRVTLRQAVP